MIVGYWLNIIDNAEGFCIKMESIIWKQSEVELENINNNFNTIG
jgi:hypothetical protein